MLNLGIGMVTVFSTIEIKQRCSVYCDRPSGCRVYPVILDEEVGIILDDICPECRYNNSDKEKKSKGKRVIKLLERIDY